MPLVLPGQESPVNAPGRRFARHHHLHGYAALVLRGTCDEVGDRGRFRAIAGDVLVHRAFDAHSDVIGNRGAHFFNFALTAPLPAGFGRVRDVDAVIVAQRRDPAEAAQLVLEQFEPVDARAFDWPDLLACELAAPRPLSIADWAERHGLHPASVSRGFRLAYGLSPKRYRLERMASRAARRIRGSSDSLAGIAADSGFADQAHMGRAIASMFGVTPARLRHLG